LKSSLLLAVLMAGLLGGCVVAPAPYSHSYYGGPVMVAPPAPRIEYPGQPPVVGHVWINGFWNWGGGRHDWVPGHWEAPRPGYAWAPHRWEHDGNAWRMQGGRWEEHREREREHEHGHDHDHDRRDWR